MLPYQNPNLPIEARLDDLIARMTLEELIPEMSEGVHSNIGTIFFALGFTQKMMLDVALG